MIPGGAPGTLSIPELGPSLGKLVSGSRADAGDVPLAPVRLQLVSRLFEQAGEARRMAEEEQTADALALLGRTAWLGAWEAAVAGATDRLLGRIDRQLDAEARAVRMPARQRARLRPTEHDRRQLMARLGSAGAGLLPVLDEVERTAVALRDGRGFEPQALAAWQEALLTAGRRLEAAWLGLEDALEAEIVRAAGAADAVSRWRRPLWPVLVIGGLALVVALWLGAMFGGFLAAPAWLGRLWQSVAP